MEAGIDPACATAIQMLDAFTSIGTTRFDVTWTDLAGDKQQFRRAVPTDRLATGLPVVLKRAEAQRHNLIVRPCPPPTLLQLDDLDSTKLARVSSAAFLSLATSPGNYQAWIALSNPGDDDFGRRLRKGTGADPTASGATRVAGSLNFKPRYAPRFPRIGIASVNAGRTASPEELEAMDLVAPREPQRQQHHAPSWNSTPMRRWPDYGRCLEGAPANHGGSGPDVSRADFTFALIAADWGWSIEDVATRLCEESVKAQENGPRYAMTTAVKAAEASARRNGSQRAASMLKP